MNEKHLPDYEIFSVNSISSNTYCVCSQARQSFSLMQTLWQHPGPNFAMFSPSKKDDLLKPKGEIMKQFQQLSVCFGCEKSSWRITLKSMLACDTFNRQTTLQWAGDPSPFSRAASGTQDQEKSFKCPTSDLLVEESGRDSTKQYWWLWEEERKDYTIEESHICLLSCWQSSVGMY